MKGIIFTEFLDMVEKKFSIDMVDQIIEASHLSHGGSYTAVGTYPHTEMVELVVNLGKQTGIPVKDLLIQFGTHLFLKLAELYPQFVNEQFGLLPFLESIENHIHIQVKKLYPDAELPQFKTKLIHEKKLEMVYISERHFGDLAEGLLIGAITFFKQEASLKRERQLDETIKFYIEII
ncbi:MAG: heme NO-binding domain-containing protein [Bacteroidia bacterium]